MLSVSEAALELGVSPSRVRKLIADGVLPARKAGRSWVLQEEDVMARLTAHVRAGRPKRTAHALDAPGSVEPVSDPRSERAHELYMACRETFGCIPGPGLVAAADSSEEAAFYMAVADFFLRQKQRELIAQGVF